MTSTLNVSEYSEHSFVIRGETKPFKEELKTLGAKWNSNLKDGPGWIISKKKKKDLDLFRLKHDHLFETDELNVEELKKCVGDGKPQKVFKLKVNNFWVILCVDEKTMEEIENFCKIHKSFSFYKEKHSVEISSEIKMFIETQGFSYSERLKKQMEEHLEDCECKCKCKSKKCNKVKSKGDDECNCPDCLGMKIPL